MSHIEEETSSSALADGLPALVPAATVAPSVAPTAPIVYDANEQEKQQIFTALVDALSALTQAVNGSRENHVELEQQCRDLRAKAGDALSAAPAAKRPKTVAIVDVEDAIRKAQTKLDTNVDALKKSMKAFEKILDLTNKSTTLHRSCMLAAGAAAHFSNRPKSFKQEPNTRFTHRLMMDQKQWFGERQFEESILSSAILKVFKNAGTTDEHLITQSDIDVFADQYLRVAMEELRKDVWVETFYEGACYSPRRRRTDADHRLYQEMFPLLVVKSTIPGRACAFVSLLEEAIIRLGKEIYGHRASIQVGYSCGLEPEYSVQWVYVAVAWWADPLL